MMLHPGHGDVIGHLHAPDIAWLVMAIAIGAILIMMQRTSQ